MATPRKTSPPQQPPCLLDSLLDSVTPRGEPPRNAGPRATPNPSPNPNPNPTPNPNPNPNRCTSCRVTGRRHRPVAAEHAAPHGGRRERVAPGRAARWWCSGRADPSGHPDPIHDATASLRVLAQAQPRLRRRIGHTTGASVGHTTEASVGHLTGASARWRLIGNPGPTGASGGGGGVPGRGRGRRGGSPGLVLC